MNKHDRLEEFIASLNTNKTGVHPCFAGYLLCFNRQDYYEAHDVLEHLWLSDRTADADFYKGLIQFAGAFVHLKKHHERPQHPKDGRRLGPAVRLFQLAIQNLGTYPRRHLRLDVSAIIALAEGFIHAIESTGYTVNPWSPEAAPSLELLPDGF
jgi:predicted metal-dependent hydrolase